MNEIGNALGELCKIIFPIPEEYYVGNSNSTVAICTLSSINLLQEIANSEILNRIFIVGRLFSENKGIDSLVRYVNQNKKIKTIIICGKEVQGHKAGHSLVQLHRNGVDENNRIVNSASPEPFLTVSKSEITHLQNEITLVDKIGQTNLHIIKKLV